MNHYSPLYQKRVLAQNVICEEARLQSKARQSSSLHSICVVSDILKVPKNSEKHFENILVFEPMPFFLKY